MRSLRLVSADDDPASVPSLLDRILSAGVDFPVPILTRLADCDARRRSKALPTMFKVSEISTGRREQNFVMAPFCYDFVLLDIS